MPVVEENFPSLLPSALDSRAMGLFDEAGIGCHLLNGEGIFLQINRVGREWLGLGAATILGRKKMSDFLTPVGRREFDSIFAKLKRGESVRGVELEWIARDPFPLLVSVSGVPIRDAWGNFLGASFLLIDISETRRLGRALDRTVLHDFGLQERNAVLEQTNQEMRRVLEEKRHEEEKFRFREYYLYRSREDLRELAVHLQEVMEEDRTRISREIHDDLGQRLTALKLDLAWACRKLADPRDAANFALALGRLAELSKDIEATLQEVRRIAGELRPATLEDLGLAAAVEFHLQEFERRTGMACFYEPEGSLDDLPGSSRTEIFRIFQEVMTNIARHAEATQVRVKLAEGSGHLLLEVSDNGRGITLQSGPAKSLGLIGMRERASLLGGVLEISGTPQKGTRIRLQVPLQSAAWQEGGEAP